MFDELLQNVRVKIATVRSILQTNDRLRRILFGQDILARKILEENQEFLSLLEVLPDENEWQVCDHCTAVTRLYAIYERFVEDLISDWLRFLPELVSCYSNLEKKIQNTHREGVGRLLIDLNKNRYQHLSVDQVVQGLFSGIAGTEKYALLPEAFLLHEQNLRKEIIEKLLADAGIENAWKWVINHREIRNFVEEVRGSQNTAEGELKQLVDYRNEAAHGAIDEILGTQELLDLGDFVEALCKALAELVTYQIISRKTLIRQAKKIGTITEWHKKPGAAVAKVRETTLSVGGNLWLVSESSSYCQLAKIESIKINDMSKEQEEITSEIEVGLKFDTDAKKGLSLYVIE
jgi:hypothetical protein